MALDSGDTERRATPDIVHDQEKQRLGAVFPERGEVGYLTYERAGTVATFTHTVVDREFGGRGIAGQLAAAALDFAREQGWSVVPRCSYIASYLERHPGYADLRHTPTA